MPLFALATFSLLVALLPQQKGESPQSVSRRPLVDACHPDALERFLPGWVPQPTARSGASCGTQYQGAPLSSAKRCRHPGSWYHAGWRSGFGLYSQSARQRMLTKWRKPLRFRADAEVAERKGMERGFVRDRHVMYTDNRHDCTPATEPCWFASRRPSVFWAISHACFSDGEHQTGPPKAPGNDGAAADRVGVGFRLVP